MIKQPEHFASHRSIAVSCRLFAVVACTWFATSCANPFGGTEPSIPEYDAKAALVGHLVESVSWPDESFAGPESPLVIGVLGPDPFGARIETVLAVAELEGRSVVLERYASLDDLRPCHLLFVTNAVSDQLDEITSAVSGLNVLTVGESRGFVRGGGMVEFRVWHGRIWLAVDTARATEEGLSLPADLVALAAPISREE